MDIDSDAIITIGGVMGVMTGFVTYVSSKIADKKVSAATVDIEAKMHEEHEKQSTSITEGMSKVLEKIEGIGDDVTQIGLNVATNTQKILDMDGHVQSIDKKATRAEEKSNVNAVNLAGLGARQQ